MVFEIDTDKQQEVAEMSERAEKVVRTALVVFLLLSCGASVPSWVWDNNEAITQSQKINAEDWDISLILKGLSETASFADTEKWWHGTWAGQVPFWRPLTSLLFWTEYQVFGSERYDYWLGVTVVMQIVICALIVVLLGRLTGNQWLGWTAALYFVGWRLPIRLGMTELLTASPASIAAQNPKDQPELLVGIFILLTLIFALSKKWAWLIVAAALAVCTKESGWLAFLALAPVVILWGGREKADAAKAASRSKYPVWRIAQIAGHFCRLVLSEIPVKWWITLGVTIAILIAARASAGSEVFWGYRLGSNSSWSLRLTNALGYFPANNLFMPGNCAAVLLGIASLLIIRRQAPIIVKAGIATTAIVAAAVVQMLATHEGMGVAVTQLLAMNWHITAATVLYLLPVVAMIKSRSCWPLAALLGGMMVIAALPYVAAAQVLRHALYLMYLFQSALIALSVQVLLRNVRRLP